MKVILISRCAWTLYNFRAGLIRSLVEKGVAVLCGGRGGDGFEKAVESLGVSFRPLQCDGGGVNPWTDLRFMRELYGWYCSENPDIVHHFTVKPVIYGSIAARYAGVPRIINTVTGLGYAFTGRRPLVRRIVESEYRFALAGSHLIFFQNAEDRELFLRRRLVNGARTDIVPGSGVDLKRFQPTASPPGPVDAPARFLMVARLLKDKGVYEFIEAARTVKKTYPGALFSLVGWPDPLNPSAVSQDELDGWQREGLVRWLGKVADVRDAIAQADIVVLPSYREGSPRSLLEGAAMAKPLIATDTVGCREVVEHGHNGLLVPVGDAAALADSMIRMINNREAREKMGMAGRAKMEREFDERLVIDKTFAAYGIPRDREGRIACVH